MAAAAHARRGSQPSHKTDVDGSPAVPHGVSVGSMQKELWRREALVVLHAADISTAMTSSTAETPCVKTAVHACVARRGATVRKREGD